MPAQCRLTRSEEAAPPSAALCWAAAGFAALRCIARMRCTVYLQGRGGGFADVFIAVRHRSPLAVCGAALDGPRVRASFVTSCNFLARHRLGADASEPGQRDQGRALLARPPAAGSCASTQAPAPHPSKACLAPGSEAAALGDRRSAGLPAAQLLLQLLGGAPHTPHVCGREGGGRLQRGGVAGAQIHSKPCHARV